MINEEYVRREDQRLEMMGANATWGGPSEQRIAEFQRWVATGLEPEDR